MCISLAKKRTKEDELDIYTIFGEMNSIVYILKIATYIRLLYYLRHISILLLKNVIICHVFNFDRSLLCHFV
ncbi:unnamed protein product [Brassica rapa]|uniref:Uncharacterized protein n=1 Tax=Brassica campestris TaxID=3711 RepID=A0A8D9CTS3_BRACM|nr:unnamed protein product [Brassica rapa]